MNKMTKKPLAIALGAAFVTSMAAVPTVSADANPFGMSDLGSGYMVVANHDGSHEGKCGEGKCGADKKAAKEGKCGEGKCGADKKAAKEGKCGEGKCGADKKAAKEGKCGDDKKAAEGKCGGKE